LLQPPRIPKPRCEKDLKSLEHTDLKKHSKLKWYPKSKIKKMSQNCAYITLRGNRHYDLLQTVRRPIPAPIFNIEVWMPWILDCVIAFEYLMVSIHRTWLGLISPTCDMQIYCNRPIVHDFKSARLKIHLLWRTRSETSDTKMQVGRDEGAYWQLVNFNTYFSELFLQKCILILCARIFLLGFYWTRIS
jgi:hypothetical protein